MSFAAGLAAMFVVALAYGVLAPLAPGLAGMHMASDSRAYAFHTGAVTGTYLIAFALAAPLWGRIAERRRRNALAAAGLGGLAIALGVMAFTHTAVELYVSATLAGLAACAIAPAVQLGAAFAEGTHRKVRFLTSLGGASFAGWFLGPVLASESRTVWSQQGNAGAPVLFLVAILALMVAFWCARAGEAVHSAHALEEAPSSPTAWTLPALTFSVAFAIGAFEISLILWSQQVLRVDTSFTSRLLLACTVVMALTQAALVFVPAARPRWSSRRATLLFALLAPTMVANAWWPHPNMALASIAVFAVLATVLQAMLSLGTVETAGPRPGSRIGLQLSLASAGQGGGSLAAASAFSASGGGFYLAAGLVLGAAGLAWLRPVHLSR